MLQQQAKIGSCWHISSSTYSCTNAWCSFCFGLAHLSRHILLNSLFNIHRFPFYRLCTVWISHCYACTLPPSLRGYVLEGENSPFHLLSPMPGSVSVTKRSHDGQMAGGWIDRQTKHTQTTELLRGGAKGGREAEEMTILERIQR